VEIIYHKFDDKIFNEQTNKQTKIRKNSGHIKNEDSGYFLNNIPDYTEDFNRSDNESINKKAFISIRKFVIK